MNYNSKYLSITNPIHNSEKNIYVSDIVYNNNPFIIDITQCTIDSSFIIIDNPLQKQKLENIFIDIATFMYENQKVWFGKDIDLEYNDCFSMLNWFTNKSNQDILIIDTKTDHIIQYNSKVNIELNIQNIFFYKSTGEISAKIHKITPILSSCNIDTTTVTNIVSEKDNKYMDNELIEPEYNVNNELKRDISSIENTIKELQKKQEEYQEKYMLMKLQEESENMKLRSLRESNH